MYWNVEECDTSVFHWEESEPVGDLDPVQEPPKAPLEPLSSRT